jgi:hypothetical protein
VEVTIPEQTFVMGLCRAPRKPVINKRLARAMKWAMKPKSKKREVKKPEEKGWFFSSKETKVEEPPKSISTVTDGKIIHLKPSV